MILTVGLNSSISCKLFYFHGNCLKCVMCVCVYFFMCGVFGHVLLWINSSVSSFFSLNSILLQKLRGLVLCHEELFPILKSIESFLDLQVLTKRLDWLMKETLLRVVSRWASSLWHLNNHSGWNFAAPPLTNHVIKV